VFLATTTKIGFHPSFGQIPTRYTRLIRRCELAQLPAKLLLFPEYTKVLMTSPESRLPFIFAVEHNPSNYTSSTQRHVIRSPTVTVFSPSSLAPGCCGASLPPRAYQKAV
jgi:hypothetical protein